jgi:ribosomal protein L13E
MDNYYDKYVKYKNKYIELKRGLVGGVLGTEQCPSTLGFFGFTTGSVWRYLREYNCTYPLLLQKIPDKVDAISYDDFQRTNIENKQNLLTVQDLRIREFPVLFLKNKEFPLDVLHKAGFPLQQLKEAGFSVSELKKAGFPLQQLKHEGFPLQQLKTEFNIYELKQAGFTLQELKSYFTLRHLNVHFTLHEIKDAGFSAKELKKAGFSAKELKDVGFTLEDLIRSQFTYDDLRRNGITINYIDSDDTNFENMIKRLDNPQLITDILNENKDVSLLQLELSIIELKKAGITAKKLKEDGADPRELIDAGFTLQELKDVFNEKDDVDKFKIDGFSAKELYDAGFTLQFLYSGSTIPNRGYNLDKFVQIVKDNYKYGQEEELKNAGVPIELIKIYYPSYMYLESI